MIANREPDEWWFKIKKAICHSQFSPATVNAKHFRLDSEPFETAFLLADFKRQRITTFRRTPF